MQRLIHSVQDTKGMRFFILGVEDRLVTAKPTYEELEQGAKELEKQVVERRQTDEAPTPKSEGLNLSNEEMENPYLVDGKYSIKDLIDMESLRKTLENFSLATGFTTGFVEYPSQEILIATGWRDICTKFHRAFPESVKHCKDSYIYLTEQLKQLKKLSIEPCENGLVDGATPIVIKGKYIAYLATGQVLFEEPDIERFKRQAEIYGYDVETYLGALSKVPVVNEEQFKNALFFLSKLAVTIGETGLNNLELKEKTRELEEEITERKRAQELLQETFEFNEKILSESPIGISIYDACGQCISANDSIGELLGATRELVLKQNYNNLESWNSGLLDKAKIAIRENSKKRHELKAKSTFGKDVSLDCHLIPFSTGGQPHLLLMISDIGERLQAEGALRQSEARLEKINECFLRFGTDSNENINRLTALCGELLGATCALYNRLDGDMLCSWGQWNTPIDYSPVDSPDGHICYDVIKSAGDETLVITNLPGTHYAQTDPNVIPYKLKTYLGRAVKLRHAYVGSLCVVYQDDIVPGEADKRVIEIIASAIGVEEARKRAEEVLRDSEEKYRTVLEGNPDPVVVYDMEGRVIYFNPAFTHVFGWTLEERLGKKLDVFVPGEAWPETKMMIEKAMEGERFSNIETRRYTKKGNIIPVSISGATYRDRDGNPLGNVINLRDIREQKKLEAQLQQAQKMEAIGTLAGSVAHDLNNILSGLVSYPELLLLKLPEGSPLRKSILTVQKSGEKAAAVVQDLLTLARRGVVVTEVVNLNDVIAEYLKSPEHENLQSYHRGIHVETHLEKDILNILGSPIHLFKTVMNLVSNAAEAMPEGGKLTVSTENRYIDRPIRGYDNVKEGDYVVLTVSDTGTGIAPDDMEKIFEPFYTKKKMGRSGTGLGMAVVWGTVKDHNGYIHLQSTEGNARPPRLSARDGGQGTAFTLYFPVTRKSLEERSEIFLKDYMGNGEAILIVDDVEEQRQIASSMLKELGYLVVSVSSGEEAVEYLKTNKVDLLLLDMIMDPGMDGLETYREILELHPRQKAIIASGFSETDRVKKLQHLGAGAYIKKPFLLEKIGLAVKEELEK